MKRKLLWALVILATSGVALASDSRMPDGTEFPAWEKPLHFSRTYYVDNKAKNADDKGPGTQQHPFLTIDKAAQVLQPGERVVIAEGVYRESIHPARGGESPDKMISYEAAPGAKVVVKGSQIVKDWRPSEGWNFGFEPVTHKPVRVTADLPPVFTAFLAATRTASKRGDGEAEGDVRSTSAASAPRGTRPPRSRRS